MLNAVKHLVRINGDEILHFVLYDSREASELISDALIIYPFHLFNPL